MGAQGQRLAVIGAGAAGCALAARLRQLAWPGPITLWEIGRGPGGRTASRRSRHDADLRFDHGAPLLNLAVAEPPLLLEPLLAADALAPFDDPVALLQGETQQLLAGCHDPLVEGRLLIAPDGMDRFCTALLQLAGEGVTPVFGQLVRHLQPRPQGGWCLLDADGAPLAEADWLVLSSTLPAHPRSRLVLGWDEAPLRRAAADLGDARLNHALERIAAIRVEPRSNLLVVCEPPAAADWCALPFRLLEFDAAARQRFGLSRLRILPLGDGRCTLVAHSSTVFATEHLSVYGSRSAVALLQTLPPREVEEAEVIQRLAAMLCDALEPWLTPAMAASLRRSDNRQLMRWGAAFPLAPGLPPDLMLCALSRVAFCGDYVSGPGFGRVEGAWRSAERLAAELIDVAGVRGA
ncbi:MAG: NAD(P)-binding protein [Prochlorococcaceae cyanobacterium]|jgi:predicted NAD/FAD-dependent oxidoreductase